MHLHERHQQITRYYAHHSHQRLLCYLMGHQHGPSQAMQSASRRAAREHCTAGQPEPLGGQTA